MVWSWLTNIIKQFIVEIFSISLISDKGIPEAVVRWNTSQMSFRIKGNSEFFIMYFFIICNQNVKGTWTLTKDISVKVGCSFLLWSRLDTACFVFLYPSLIFSVEGMTQIIKMDELWFILAFQNLLKYILNCHSYISKYTPLNYF